MCYRKKAQLRKIKRVIDVEEKMLFHGTGHSNIQAICTYNFDWRLTGSHGDVYGKGIFQNVFINSPQIEKGVIYLSVQICMTSVFHCTQQTCL